MGRAGILLHGLFAETTDMGMPSWREEGFGVLDCAMTSVDINSSIKVAKVLNVRIDYCWFESCNSVAKLCLFFQIQQLNQALILHDFYTILSKSLILNLIRTPHDCFTRFLHYLGHIWLMIRVLACWSSNRQQMLSRTLWIFLSLITHPITPITYSSGTTPQYRESAELATLSPAMK